MKSSRAEDFSLFFHLCFFKNMNNSLTVAIIAVKEKNKQKLIKVFIKIEEKDFLNLNENSKVLSKVYLYSFLNSKNV